MWTRVVLLALSTIDAIAFVATGRTVAARAAILTRTLAAALALALGLLLAFVTVAPVLPVAPALVTRRTRTRLSAIRWRCGSSGVGGRCGISRGGGLRCAIGPALMLLMAGRTPFGTAAGTPDLDEGLFLGLGWLSGGRFSRGFYHRFCRRGLGRSSLLIRGGRGFGSGFGRDRFGRGLVRDVDLRNKFGVRQQAQRRDRLTDCRVVGRYDSGLFRSGIGGRFGGNRRFPGSGRRNF
jgi:hypothetical protein